MILFEWNSFLFCLLLMMRLYGKQPLHWRFEHKWTSPGISLRLCVDNVFREQYFYLWLWTLFFIRNKIITTLEHALSLKLILLSWRSYRWWLWKELLWMPILNFLQNVSCHIKCFNCFSETLLIMFWESVDCSSLHLLADIM